MKKIILIGLLCFATLMVQSQEPNNCGELVIDFCHLSEDGKALEFSVAATTNIGTSYSYPNFLLLNNHLDTIAISKVKHYGIPGYLVKEKLELQVDTLVEFEGILQVNSGNKATCSIPISFKSEMLKAVPDRSVFAGFTVDEKSVLIDIKEFHRTEILASMANSRGEEIFQTSIDRATTVIPVPDLEQGIYHVWIHDKAKNLRFTYQLHKK